MYIEPCPKCGRRPKIIDLPPHKKYKNGIRRRSCRCPSFCSVIPSVNNMFNASSFEFDGEGDANRIYRVWNRAIALYKENLDKPWYERIYKNFNRAEDEEFDKDLGF